MPNKKDILDLYFMDARYKLIDIAAFLDRLDRHAVSYTHLTLPTIYSV